MQKDSVSPIIIVCFVEGNILFYQVEQFVQLLKTFRFAIHKQNVHYYEPTHFFTTNLIC